MAEKIQELDFAVLDFICEHFRTPFLDRSMPLISFLGNGGLIWLVIAGAFLLVKGYRKCGVTMLLGMFSGVMIGNLIIKNLVRRERPCWIREIDTLIAVPLDYSFPSGHTLCCFAATAVIFCFHRKLGIAALILSSAIAFSRLYLYVHFPTDVLAGAILGTAIGLAAVKLARRYLFSRFEEKTPAEQ